MDSLIRDRLHGLVLKARPLLIGEARDLLQGVYGLGADGQFVPPARLPVVQMIAEAGITRVRLETFIADEVAAGLTPGGAVEKLVKEVAFTHLNRLVALKMLESRKLVKGTLDRYHNANAFAFYRAAHPDEEARYQAGTMPQNGLGEGPRDIAYRHFLLAQYAEMATQVRVLFDPDNLPSRLFPRPYVLNELIAMLNGSEITDAWLPGNEETIGWIYQYFNEPDLDAYRGASAPKVPAHMIAPKTQQYTPRWIVKFLVHNTLGRLWMSVHPDSRLRDDLDYLVPMADETSTPLRLAREITLLDPACGTMHFGLVAFDLFATMYQEEIERAGEPGWSKVSSVADSADIPGAIVEHNLFGVDIDLRAVQLSALTLLIKARSLNPKAHLTDHNLACADVLLLNGPRLTAFLTETGLGPIYERLIRALWARLKDSNQLQLGSLMRLEADLEDLITGERRKFEAERDVPHLPGFPADQFDTEAGRQEFWDIVQGQIVQAFDAFAREHAREGQSEQYFAGEATKGLRLLDVMLRRFDIVATNPPYLDNRDYNKRLKDVLDPLYPEGKQNLYAAFVVRSLEFLVPGGRLGIVTPHTFMFISSFERLREHISDRTAIENLVHTGLNTFPDAVVDCAFYVL